MNHQLVEKQKQNIHFVQVTVCLTLQVVLLLHLVSAVILVVVKHLKCVQLANKIMENILGLLSTILLVGIVFTLKTESNTYFIKSIYFFIKSTLILSSIYVIFNIFTIDSIFIALNLSAISLFIGRFFSK